MFRKLMVSFLAISLFVGSALAQTPVPPTPPTPKTPVPTLTPPTVPNPAPNQTAQTPNPAAPTAPTDLVLPSASVVPGLELPADQNVSFDEGFVSIQAITKGDVKWLVTTANARVKYIAVSSSNSIIVSIPPTGGQINVFAVALVDGKMTDFARTTITVSEPQPAPIPGNVTQKLHLTFLVDMNNVNPDMAKLLNSEGLRKGINQRGHWFRLYDIKSPLVAQKKLDQVVQRVGGNSVLVIQSDDGRVINAMPIPQNDQAIFTMIQQITGK